MNNYNPQRTFIHEVGHFVARELNKKIYNIGNGVEQIFITGDESLMKSIKGLGGTVPKKPENLIENDEVKNPIELTTVLLYGCLFQSIYTNTKFDNCFNIQSNASGKKDVEHFISLEKYFNGKKRRTIVDFFCYNYFEELSLSPNHFNEINQLNYQDYILEKNDGDYIIDIENLNKDLKNFLSIHEEPYKKLIEKISYIYYL